MLLSASAHAIPAGVYECHIEQATLTTPSGERRPLESGLKNFDLYAFAKAGDPSSLRGERRQLNYQAVEEVALIATVDARLFEEPTTALVSDDGVRYAQGGVEFRFTESLAFTAAGRVSFDGDDAGVALYEGSCAQR